MDAMAAFGFVHVVGRDEHGQALSRKAMDFVPEIAPRHRARRPRSARRAAHSFGLWIMQRQAPGVVSIRRTRRRPAAFADWTDRAFRACCRHVRAWAQFVEAGDELKIFLDRQVFVKRKALRHVADFALDRDRSRRKSKPRTLPSPSSAFNKSAQAADRRRLAGAVRPEKAGDLPGRNLTCPT